MTVRPVGMALSACWQAWTHIYFVRAALCHPAKNGRLYTAMRRRLPKMTNNNKKTTKSERGNEKLIKNMPARRAWSKAGQLHE